MVNDHYPWPQEGYGLMEEILVLTKRVSLYDFQVPGLDNWMDDNELKKKNKNKAGGASKKTGYEILRNQLQSNI